MCSKLNPRLKPAPKFEDTQLAGGYGALAASQSNVALLRRAVLANLLWEDIAYMDGERVTSSIHLINESILVRVQSPPQDRG